MSTTATIFGSQGWFDCFTVYYITYIITILIKYFCRPSWVRSFWTTTFTPQLLNRASELLSKEKGEVCSIWNERVAQSSLETRIHPGFDFINVLREAFTLVDPKSVKKIDNLTVFFTLLGSLRVKAVRRTLMKLSPGFTVYIFASGLRTKILVLWTPDRVRGLSENV